MSTALKLTRPDWDDLYEVAAGQAGYFTTSQAKEAGYSLPLLHKHNASGRIEKVRRGIHRLAHFPATENEELVVLWLWSKQQGYLSHETALALHDLSDTLPSGVHMTVPEEWSKRRLRIPDGLSLHYADVDEQDTGWLDVVPLTQPTRTIADCIDAHLSPDLIEQAIDDARSRGLISRKDVSALLSSLRASQEGIS